MRALARRHPLGVFLAITYAATVAIFAFPFLSNAGLGVIDVDLPGAAPFILLSTFALAGAAFAVTALADGRDGVRALRRRVLRFRVNPAWYLIGFLLLPLAGVAAAMAFTGLEPIANLVADPNIVVSTILIGGLMAFLLVNWWEETGWTGFALHRLQPRLGPIGASVVTTWLQALLHLPLVFIADGVTDGRVAPEQIPFYLVALFVLPIPVRLVITWIYNSTGRSLPIVGLYHAGLGVATGSDFIPAIAPSVDPIWVYAGFAVLAAIVLAATRGRLGFGPAERAKITADAVATA
jgi:membrane protease YdiL (CAAX protease family)